MTPSLRLLGLGLFSLALLGASAADASRIRRDTFTCPIGGQKFEGRVVMSGYQHGLRLDLRPYGAIVSPRPLPKCPGNGFVMYKDEFSKEELEKLKPVVASKEYKTLAKTHHTHYLAAFLREKTGDVTDAMLATYYLRASWQAEGSWGPERQPEAQSKTDRDLVVRYRTMSLEKLNASLASETRGSKDWWRSVILAAELERLLGRFEAAQKRLTDLPETDASEGQRSAMKKIRTLAAASNAQPAPQRDE